MSVRLTWCQPLKAGLLAPYAAGIYRMQPPWQSGSGSAKYLGRRGHGFKLPPSFFAEDSYNGLEMRSREPAR